MSTVEERVAVLESLAERSQSDIESMFTTFRNHTTKEEKELDEIKGLIHKLAAQQSKQRTFLGAVLWTVSSMFIAAQAFYKYIINGGS